MSRIRANTIVNGAGTGAPNFPRGAIISGISTITADIDAGNIDIGTGTSLSSPGSNELAVGTNNSERIRINTVGDIGINKSSVVSFGSAIPTIEIKGGATSGGLTPRSGAICFESGSGTNGYAALWGHEGGIEYYSSSTDRSAVTYGFKFTSGGNIAFASGKGIDFSATSDGSGGTTTSEILTEYEEGTFTPKYITTTGGDAGITMLTQKGTYTRIGNLVYIQLVLATSDWSSGVSGDIRIADLPYALNDADTNVGSFNISFRREWSTDVGANLTARFVNSSGTPYIYFYKNTTNSAGSTNLNAADFMDGASENYMYGSGIYALL